MEGYRVTRTYRTDFLYSSIMVRSSIACLILAVLLTAATSAGQNRPVASEAVHIDAMKPTIYITSVKTPALNGDIVLTIHNNSIFDLSFCTRASVEPSAPTTYPCYSIESGGHSVKRGRTWKWVGGPHVPDLGPPPDIVDDYTLRSGASVNFQVPPQLLLKGLRVVMSFRYPWEKPWFDFKAHVNGEPVHRISYERGD
jgi:hypothetical protein